MLGPSSPGTWPSGGFGSDLHEGGTEAEEEAFGGAEEGVAFLPHVAGEETEDGAGRVAEEEDGGACCSLETGG